MRRNERRISSLLISFLLACSFPLPGVVLAQTQTTGSIAGRLTDIRGAVITGASVALTSRATGAQTTATTDQTGNYRFNLLPPGAYALRFSANGFKTGVPEDITVTVTETSTVNLALSPGQQQETVQVMATAAALQTENATLGTTVEGSTIQTLPLPERNYTQILTLSPGVAGNVNDASQLGRGTLDVYVNGASNISNNFAMDGADINNFGSGRGGDFVQQGGILTLSRIFKLGSSEKRTLDFRGEFFNAFNHVQYADPAVAYGTASFGSIQSTSVAPRIIQLAAKLQF